MAASIEAFFDEATNTVSYIVSDPETKEAAIIDSVLDFDPASGKISTESADRLIERLRSLGLKPVWILETHAHADHLSAAGYLKHRTGAPIGIGGRIDEVQHIFRPRFGISGKQDGEGFDHMFADGERIPLGTLEFEVISTPGHTPACVSYRIGDAVFVGDTLFMPDYGTARADFPGGDARTLYRSIRRLLSLPPETRLFMCHDYKAPGRDAYAWETTVGAEREGNVHVKDGISEDEFVAMREARDATLDSPRLLLPSLQVNVEGGRLPDPAPDGARRLALPLNVPETYAEA
ncbi:MBL fold metallo-hydrolase [Sandaracinobacteroides sp. A072]|uniref:MBL fold metallo-hydrolase n=1 Tax=Sandaracinobacteroides sp. A072 TaxID=3461146 RepID=UPI00404332BE